MPNPYEPPETSSREEDREGGAKRRALIRHIAESIGYGLFFLVCFLFMLAAWWYALPFYIRR